MQYRQVIVIKMVQPLKLIKTTHKVLKIAFKNVNPITERKDRYE